MTEPSPIKAVEVSMTRPHLRDIPPVAFPDGFTTRPVMGTDGSVWTAVQRATEKLAEITDDLFRREFGTDENEIAARCFLLYSPEGEAIGTISAWYSRNMPHRNSPDGKDAGRIHWVSVRPDFQGKGLGKAILSFALEKLAERHTQAWLATSTGRIPAVRMYLNYGFVPDIHTPADRATWRDFAAASPHPLLAGLDLSDAD